MKKTLLSVIAVLLFAPAIMAAQDVTATVHQFIDAFNAGDMKATDAAYASTGNIAIIDEYAPYIWVGRHAGQDWAAAYDKHAQATGVTDGKVEYSPAVRQEVDGEAAYVVLPTVYNYKEHGKAMTERGHMTFVLHKEKGAWKIAAWTWTGAKPQAAK